MRNAVLSFCVCLTLFLPLFGFTHAAASEGIDSASLDLSLGYRVDQLDWTIAGNAGGTNPNILSELTWEDLNIVELRVDGRVEISNKDSSPFTTVLKGTLAYGQIVSGENQDSDFGGDNRTLEWSRSNNASDDGKTLDWSGAIGLKYRLPRTALALTPLVGYSYHRQDLEITDGLQTLSDDAIFDAIYGPGPDGPAPLGSIAGLNSSYDARWRGPWVGLDMALAAANRWLLRAGAEYHWADYVGKANWNLRSDLQHPLSFQHDADGTGIVFNLAAEYLLSPSWALLLSANYQDWQADTGTHRSFFTDETSGLQQLNGVNWESYALLVGLRSNF